MIVRCHHQAQNRMSITEKILVLTLLQGLLPGLLCQRWEIPSEIVGLVGSCVEIPCSVYPGTSSTVWYLYNRRGYPQIFNSQESSAVLMEYRDRTSLVPGSRSCSLRIDPVRSNDGGYYYPAIANDRDTNAYSLYQRYLQLHITDAPKDVTVSLPENTTLLEGSDVILTCTSRSNPPPQTYEWYRTISKIKLGPQGQTIIVLNVSKDVESFSCAAINTVGRGESPPTKIPVQHAATGVQVIELHPEEGATELKCSFVSSSPNVTHYTWMKDGNILIDKTGQILILDNNEDESGSYYCIAHNKAGSSSSTEMDFTDSKVDAYGFNYFPILGVLAGVILLIMIIFLYIRTKARNRESKKSMHEDSKQPDATYTDLVKTEVSTVYETIPPSVPASGKHLPSNSQYENIPRK